MTYILIAFTLACALVAAVLHLVVLDFFGKLKWDKTVDSERDGLPVLYIKNLFHLWGRRIDFHKIIYPDPWECFHSHPANAIRVVVFGGYSEEYYDGHIVNRKPGHVGLVRHSDVHRINRLLSESPSYSLWFRGKVRHQTQLRGTGWPVELQDTWHGSSEK